MRGVIEEKTNRIVEVIVTSVKPFQLMIITNLPETLLLKPSKAALYDVANRFEMFIYPVLNCAFPPLEVLSSTDLRCF